jgi:hypothetical protein
MSQESEARSELDKVRAAMKGEEWIDLPWFTARPDAVDAAYLDSETSGFDIF